MHRVVRALLTGVVVCFGLVLFQNTAKADENLVEDKPQLKVVDEAGQEVGNRRVFGGDILRYQYTHEVTEDNKEADIVFEFRAPKAVKYKIFRAFDSEGNPLYHGDELNVSEKTGYNNGSPGWELVDVVFNEDYKDSLKVGDTILFEYEVEVKNGSFSDNLTYAAFDGTSWGMLTSPGNVKINVNIRDKNADILVDRVRIYTNSASKGLPIITDISTADKDAAAFIDKDIDITVKTGGNTVLAYKVPFKKATGGKGKYSVSNMIPPTGLVKGKSQDYTIIVKVGGKEIGTVNMKGYASSEKSYNLGLNPTDPYFSLMHKSVVMTEGIPNRSFKEFTEEIAVETNDSSFTFTPGSYIDIAVKPSYRTTLSRGDILKNFEGYDFDIDLKYDINMDYRMVEPTLAFFDKNANYKPGDTIKLPVTKVNQTEYDFFSSSPPAWYKMTTYSVPILYFDKTTKEYLTKSQVKDLPEEQVEEVSPYGFVTAMWPEESRLYGVYYKSSKPMGGDRITVRMDKQYTIDKFLFYHLDSTTKDKDVILITPVSKSEMPYIWR